MKRRNKGFTLAELLIVVAIIAVLVAVAIPVFTAQLEKARVATMKANIRSALAEAKATILNGEEGLDENAGIYFEINEDDENYYYYVEVYDVTITIDDVLIYDKYNDELMETFGLNNVEYGEFLTSAGIDKAPAHRDVAFFFDKNGMLRSIEILQDLNGVDLFN